MRAVITVVGKDKPGILAYIATKCAEREINIVDVTQTVLQDLFTMIMIVEVPSNLENFRMSCMKISSIACIQFRWIYAY